MEKLRNILTALLSSPSPSQEAIQRDSEGLFSRPAELRDIEALEEINRSAYFDVGLHNLKLFYQTSPQSWFVVVNDKDEVIAYTSYNDLPNGIQYGYQIMVREDYRGRKVTSKYFGTDWRNVRNVIGSVGPNSLCRYKFATWKHKSDFYYGISYPSRFEKPVGHTAAMKGVKVRSLSPKHFKSLATFDKDEIIKVDRSDFLKSWAIPDEKSLATTLVALKSGKIVGYGVLRNCSGYFSLSPVYALEPSVGVEILHQLASLVPEQNIFVPFPADCVTTLRFCVQAGLIQTATEMKSYGDLAWQYAKGIPMERVYAVHEYWPV